MKIEFSAAVSLALTRAAALADREGRAEPASLDFLRGLLAEPEGQVARLLADAGLNVPDFVAVHGAGAVDLVEADENIGLGAAGAHILRQAQDMARWHSAEGTITSDQWLLALLEADESLRRLLERYGLDYGRLRPDLITQPPPLPMTEPLDLETPRDRHDVARILDAAANRAREGLRVLEDVARFALDDAVLTRSLKTMRHDLACALASFTGLVESRDTLQDVGTEVKAADEHQRASMNALIRANARRVQEALRSLEEFAKITAMEGEQGVWDFGPAARAPDSAALAGGPPSVVLEKLRYQAYTLERALLLGQDARSRLAQARLYVLVTEALCRASLTGTVQELLAGGADVIQLREKNLDDRTLLEKARQVRRLTRAAGALFIVNDRPDIALLAEADGVHLGQEDLPLREARRILGPNTLLGVSTHHLDQVERAVLEGASYIGVGPTFPSRTKSFAALAGLELVRQAAAATSLPAFVLGGVNLDNAPAVLGAGGRRIAVSHCLCAAADPRAEARKLKTILVSS